MNSLLFLTILVFVEIIGIFFLSRLTIGELFYFFRTIFKKEKIVLSLVSLFFLPGTLVHEMAHFITATILALKVREVKLFPEFGDKYIKLGSVIYEKKDVVRSILVGVAPIFMGFFCFWFFGRFNMFPQKNVGLNILFGYLIFTISTTMFSSKQDLIDIVFIIPLFIFIFGIIYIFKIDIVSFLSSPQVNHNLVEFMQNINFYLIFSLLINVALIAFFKSLRLFFKK